jgi:hypothetical protein
MVAVTGAGPQPGIDTPTWTGRPVDLVLGPAWADTGQIRGLGGWPDVRAHHRETGQGI